MSLPRLLAGVVVALALLVGLAPTALGIPARLGPPAAVVVLALGFWATNALEMHLTALLVFAIVTWFGITTPEVIFAGFAATGLWLVFGGLVVAAGIETSGLGERLARLIAGGLGGSYRRMIYMTVLICLAVSFLVPAAMGRLVILLPIFRAIARRSGFEDGSRGSTGIMLAAAFGTFVPAFAILPANLPNMVLLGAMETLYGEHISYVSYLVLHFPVLGLLKALLLAELTVRLYPAGASAPARPVAVPANGRRPLSPVERRLTGILIGALVLWATDWLHGISPGWVALLAGLVCLLPGIGVVDRATFEREISFSSIFYVAGLLGLVRLIDESGLGDALGQTLLEHLPLAPEAPAGNFAALVGLNALTSLLTALAGMPAVLTPLAQPIAEATGFSRQAVLMVQVIGFSALLLPYQSAPIMVALAMARVPLATATRLSLAQGLLTLLVLAPLDYLWWRTLGLLG